MADVQVELKEEKREENRTTRTPAAAAKRTRGTTSRQVEWGEDDFAESLLGHVRSGHNKVKLVRVDLAKQKKPRAQPVKKPRRLHWARKWAAEPEWVAPKEESKWS